MTADQPAEPPPSRPRRAARPDAMVRRTMRVGGTRTSVKLEPAFWEYLQELAAGRGLRLSALVGEVAAAARQGGGANLASALRTFALAQARRRGERAGPAPPSGPAEPRTGGCRAAGPPELAGEG